MPVLPAPGLPRVYAGKTRDIYALSDDPATADRLLIVTSDRLSACDRVLDALVPDKGRVLTALSGFWFDHLRDVLPGHLLSTDVGDLPPRHRILANDLDLHGRVAIVRRAQMLPVECIVRSCLTGSAWREYRETGTVSGTPLPSGLRHADRLPEPMFTPTTKAVAGQRDVNIPRPAFVRMLSASLAAEVEEASLALYQRGASWARQRGILLADSKFELGFVGEKLVLCDEVLTPDSSRFWAAPDRHDGGDGPESFDKELVRTYLDRAGWRGQGSPPTIPAEILENTRQRYIQAYEILSGRSFATWPGVWTRVRTDAPGRERAPEPHAATSDEELPPSEVSVPDFADDFVARLAGVA